MKKSRLRILNSQVGSSPFPPFTFISWLFVYGYSGWLVGEIIGFPYLLAAVAVVVGFFPAMKWMLTSLVTSEPSFLDFGSIIMAILLVILPRNPAAWFGAVTSLLTISLFGYVIVKNKLSKMYSESKKCNTPLHLAVMDGRKEIVETLIEKGADVNATNWKGNTPLHLALIGDHKEIAERLLKEDTDVNTMNEDDSTALLIVLRDCDIEKDIVKRLIEKGADVNLAGADGFTPMHETLMYRPKEKEIVEWLIEKGADVNLADYLGNTPLHRASYIGNKDTVKLLIAGGADVNATDNNGNTPLHSASKHGRENIVELLIASSDVVNTTK